MKKRILIPVIALILLLAAGLTAFLLLRNQDRFDGDRVKNPDSYTLDFERMNGDDTHTMRLEAGDALQVQIEIQKGSLHLEIQSPDGSVLYEGNGTEATAFTVGIPESGVYTISVEARHAKGFLHIRLADSGQDKK